MPRASSEAWRASDISLDCECWRVCDRKLCLVSRQTGQVPPSTPCTFCEPQAKCIRDKRNENKKLLKALVVLGSLAVIVAGWILLNRWKRLGYVDSAIGSIRVLVKSENNFAQTHPDIGYACTLSALPSDDLTAELVKKGRRNGYTFQIDCPADDAKQPNTRYLLTARPLVMGMAAFCSDQTGVVKYDDSGSIEKCLENGVPIPDALFLVLVPPKQTVNMGFKLKVACGVYPSLTQTSSDTFKTVRFR